MGMGFVNDPSFGPMREGISEVIATTRLNAAPMGIICRKGRLMIVMFRTSHTASNIEKEGCIVANITSDPILFVKTAFDDLSPGEFITEEIKGRKIWRLKEASSWVVYDTRVDQRTEQKILVSLTPVHSVLSDVPPVPVNRGLNSVIEAAVHGTRYILTRDPELRRYIDHHADIILRCGGERESEALRLLLEYIA
jgi:hypothetical protein